MPSSTSLRPVRMSLKYIQLVTVCYSSGLKRFGASKIVGGGTDDPWDGRPPVRQAYGGSIAASTWI